MDDAIEKRRSIALAVLLGLVALIAVIYYFWGNVINRGTVNFIAQAPFQIEIHGAGDDAYFCERSPCEIKSKSGSITIIARKDGFESIVEVVGFKLWRSTDHELDFKIIPQIQKTETYPALPKEYSYKLIDTDDNRQKLVNADDEVGVPLAFFNNLKDPLIIGSKNAVLIAEDEIYKVDLKQKKTYKIDFDQEIVDGKFDQQGEQFIFQTANSNALYLLNTNNEIIELDLQTKLKNLAFTPDGKLIFGQKLDDNSYTLNIFFPQENRVEQIDLKDTFKSPPFDIIPMPGGHEVYLKLGRGEKFRVGM
jgi:hypothetical protein